MSCDHNRAKFFEIMSASGQVGAEQLERAFQQNRHIPATDGERLAAEAKTLLLFAAIAAQGLKPPTHSANGLPRADARTGYAAVYDLLRQNGLLGEAEAPDRLSLAHIRQPPDPNLGPDGRDGDGYDRWGYNKNGYDRRGKDRQGYNVGGWDKDGRNRHGFSMNGYSPDGFNPAGYDAHKNGRDGLTFDGYDPKTFLDQDGYDRDGFDVNGYDRTGYNRAGFDQDRNPDPTFAPDADGIYPDGFDAHSFARDGYSVDGYDRYGFGRDGYNRAGVDRNGNNRRGHPTRTDLEGYNPQGYKLGPVGYRRFDRAGYDEHGFDVSNVSATGFNSVGNDKNGLPRMAANAKGKLVPVKFRKDGFDDNGYDRWGFHKDTGLNAPDASGRRINSYGWVYDEQTKECYDPVNPTRRARHRILYKSIYIPGRRGAVPRICAEAYFPPVPPAPIMPLEPMSESEYERSSDRFALPSELHHTYLSYEQIQNRIPTVNERRTNLHPQACKNGVQLRCPHCGQFTGGRAHNCPKFGQESVFVYHSGLVQEAGRDAPILAAPLNPDFDPHYDNDGGYDSSGRDRDGFDRYGYNERGFDREGYSSDGFDIFGYDRDGFDRHGYNNAGFNRHGGRRERSLEGVSPLLEEDEDLLANQNLARMYGQIATGLIGKPRRVVLNEGGGFATDMKGTIYADPYPLGRTADPRHNLVVTRAGIYHELGHEQFTPTQIWERVLAVRQGQQTEDGLGEAGRAMLPRFYNIVEDGRMERQVARNYAGAAEILAASCRLEPRWGEEVGVGVPEDRQVFWALLYTGLPYFRVRAEVREGMSPRARALFEELEPVISRAVRGDPEDAWRAAVHLARRFEEEGLIHLPPKEEDYSRELPGGGSDEKSGGQPGSGKGQDGKPGDEGQANTSDGAVQGQSDRPGSAGVSQPEVSGTGRGASSQDQPRKGRGRGGSRDDDQTNPSARSSEDEEQATGNRTGRAQDDPSAGKDPSGESSGAGAESLDDVDEWLFGNETVDAAIAAVERDATAAIEGGVRARSRASTIGLPLHRPLPERSSINQRYRGVDSMPVSVDVQLPTDDTPHPELGARRERHRQVANLMAKPLRAIREQAEQRMRRLPQGKLDRRQLVNAYKGMDDIYTATKERPQTSFAASIAVDMSGSMLGHIQEKELFDAVMVLGDTFELLDMPHEVRAFGSSTAQLKAMDEPFAPKRAAYLASGNLGGTLFNDTAGLGHSSLLAREEKNRMMICLSDGVMSDHEESVHSLRQARTNGILTFGIFLGAGHDPEKMDQLYGKGNWTSIQTLGDMPKAVAQRLASIFKSIR